MKIVFVIFVLFIFAELFFRVIYYIKKKNFFFLWPEENKKVLNFKQHPYCLYVKKENNSKAYVSNNYGYVGNQNVEKIKPNNTIRLYFAGGSTIEDYYNSDPNSHWPGRLTKKLSKNFKNINFQCFNAGCSGYTTAESLSEFMYRGVDFSPDFLIIYHNINDAWSVQMIENFKSDYSHARINKRFDNWLLKMPSFKIIFLYEYFKKILLNFVLKPGLIHWISNPPFKLSKNKNPNAVLAFERNLINLIVISKAWNCTPIVVNWESNLDNIQIPFEYDGNEIDKKELLKYYVKNNNLVAKKISDKFNCPYYNIGPLDPKYFVEDGVHFNSSGLEEISSRLFKVLQDDIKNFLNKKNSN